MIKKIIASTLLATMVASISYADTKIATVNPATIFDNTNVGSVSVKKLENDLKPQALELKQQREAIIKQMQDLQKSASTMTKSVLQQKQLKIQKEQQEFTLKAQNFQKQEEIKKQKLSAQFQNSFNNAVDSVAKKDGYNLVLTSQAVAYSQGIDDISNQVIQKMNQENN